MQRSLLAGFLILAACSPTDPAPVPGAFGGAGGRQLPTVLFEGKSQTSERAAPITGGTLIVTRDDSTLVAADPDRDRISFVSLRTLGVSQLDLEPLARPGKLTELGAGRVAVILRGKGTVAAFDVASRALSFEVPACREPRALAYDAAANALWVACRSGRLLKLDADSGAELARQQLDDDLVDVAVRGSEVVVLRGRSAEVSVVDASGRVSKRGTPAGDVSTGFRSLVLAKGEIVLLHQVVMPGVGDFYGAFGDPCGPVAVGSALSLSESPQASTSLPPSSTADPRDGRPESKLGFQFTDRMPGFVGPIDAAVAPEAGKLALLAIGNGFGPLSSEGSLMIVSLDPSRGTIADSARTVFAGCGLLRTNRVAGEPVAVALDSRGRAFVQSREPAALLLENGASIPLGNESRADTGLALFYMNTGAPIACASCHPEGLEDGNDWLTLLPTGELGPRRTQSLAGGLSRRAPYHWAGQFATLSELVHEVMLRRMQLPLTPKQAQIDALGTWLEGIPAPSHAEELDAAAVERGRALFDDSRLGCAACHAGADFTDGSSHDVGTGGVFKTPSLVGLSARAPFYHDGCASTVARTLGVCGGRSHSVELEPAQRDDLAHFLSSL